MTERQRRARAEFISEEPVMGLTILYAAAFLGCSGAIDLMYRFLNSPSPGSLRYIFPLGMAAPAWIGLRGWAKRVLEARATETE